MSDALPRTIAVRVWDLPTRAFHWMLALCIVGSVISAKIGGNAMVWHFRFGYVVFTLLAFRLLWGLVGGRWSRFASFVYAPGTVFATCAGRRRADEHLDVGHNPLGSLSVFALLGFLALQVATGLVADDEIASRRPAEPLRQRRRCRPGHALAQGLSASGSCWRWWRCTWRPSSTTWCARSTTWCGR